MIYLVIALLAILVFGSRYLFLEPRLPLRLGPRTLKLLSYSTPAVLASIVGPIVFIQEQQLVSEWNNAYVLGALSAVIMIVVTKRTLLTAVVSMAVFLLLHG